MVLSKKLPHFQKTGTSRWFYQGRRENKNKALVHEASQGRTPQGPTPQGPQSRPKASRKLPAPCGISESHQPQSHVWRPETAKQATQCISQFTNTAASEHKQSLIPRPCTAFSRTLGYGAQRQGLWRSVSQASQGLLQLF